MYPNLYYAFKDLFGVNWNGLRFINSFGFFVALSFLAAAYILTLELKRKERAGLLTGQDVKMIVGKQASAGELLLNFFLGFLLGYKIIGLFISGSETTADPQQYIFSSEGNWPIGIALGLLFAGLKWWEKHKQKLDKPEERTIRIWPHDRVGDLVIYAALFGFLGAKIFHNLENWQDFKTNPIEALLSFSGLTFYGGLICAAVAIYYYSRKHKIDFRHLCDAIAPALILAYSIGRIGCQVAGDGDWGILNSAYVTEMGPESKVQPADTTRFQNTLQAHNSFYLRTFQVNNVSEIPHARVKAPAWLPNWLFAYSYPHNVVNEGVRIPGCEEEQFCNQLPIPVFPTPFYETVFCFLLFLFLWSLRKKLKVPGTLFGVYLIVNGIERFFVEQIRVNTKYSIFGFHPTQAEIIAVCLVLAGAALYLYMKRKYGAKIDPLKA
ncbi:prolipoprotein diacylglyceryl transferase [Longitalea luteola]|uniref:prolipoprotein diacylglyceryl transferase n=1 Tax=Longitalea luteola TaxID=2812563 RepID=UPI001A9672ED|nr:prolipoprotein diacylglyceryl transferase family protein [Longitalea luteola]